MSNKAKDWQQGRYWVDVYDNRVKITKMTLFESKLNGENTYVHGSSAIAKCDPEDEFNLVEGVNVAMQRLEQEIKPQIKAGDFVRIVDKDLIYPNYDEWVVNLMKSGKICAENAARFCYDSDSPDISVKYRVIKVAPHLVHSDRILALIESNTFMEYCYIIDVEGLEKC